MRFLIPVSPGVEVEDDVAVGSGQDEVDSELMEVHFAADEDMELVGDLLLDVFDGPLPDRFVDEDSDVCSKGPNKK